jgi:AcrR family transcriptional regulator
MVEPTVTTDSPAPSRRERNAARTRTAITQAARRLFDEHGYDGTTVEQIADAADVAPRTVFRYFPTKESILFAELDDVRRQILERFDAVDPQADPLPALLAVLDAEADEVQRRLDGLSWGFRVAQEHAAAGPGRAHAENTLRVETSERLAERLATRLGVDPETDPRPQAWTAIAMALFGAAVKAAAQDETGRTKVRTVFRRLVDQTGAALTTR